MNKIILTLAFVTWSIAAQAGVEISGAWTRATAPGQEVGAAFMTLTSSDNASLVSASSPVAKNVEIHRMSMDNGVMKMRMLDSLPLPAGKSVKLDPDGLHLMLLDLKKSLKEGDKVEISLTLKDSLGKLTIQKVNAPVKVN